MKGDLWFVGWRTAQADLRPGHPMLPAPGRHSLHPCRSVVRAPCVIDTPYVPVESACAPAPATSPPSNNNGFSLFELLVSMAIVGLVLALAVPAFTKSQGSGRAAPTRSPPPCARRATNPCSQEVLALLVDVEQRQLQLGGDGRQRQLPEELNLEITTAEREMLSGDRGGIRFFPGGSSTGGRIILGLCTPCAGRTWSGSPAG